MRKLLSLGLLLLSSIGAVAQKPTALDAFTNPGGAFQFSYPDNYEPLSGERLLKATQGSNLGYPVCDFATALVCVIYPIERLDNTKLEGAGLSVNAVPGVTVESDCLGYADRFTRPGDVHSQPSSSSIRGRAFRHISVRRRMDSPAQSSDLYRTFYNDRCYELRVEVSLTEEGTSQQRALSKSAEAAVAESARESLMLILSSVAFRS